MSTLSTFVFPFGFSVNFPKHRLGFHEFFKNTYLLLHSRYFLGVPYPQYVKGINKNISMNATRKLVLQTFKKLHRTRLKVFAGDTKALTAGRQKINEEYKKNKLVTDQEAIKAMIKFSEDVEKELRTQVIQAVEVRPGVFEAKLRQDIKKFDNIPYNEKAIPKGVEGAKCCQDEVQNK